MDGAMHKTVLIILAAVVVLIVIVVLTGMRYLRADDEDDFDDEMAEEHGQSRARGNHPSRDHWRSRHHDEDRVDVARQRERDDRGTSLRASSGRRRGDHDDVAERAFAGVGAGRDSGRGATSSDGAPGAPYGRGYDRGGSGRPSERRNGEVRDSASRELGRDIGRRDDRPSNDDRGRNGDRGRSSSSHRDQRSASARDYDDRDYADLGHQDSARPLGGRDAGGWDSPSRDGGRDVVDRDTFGGGRDDRDRRGNSGSNARPDSRKVTASQSRRDESLPDVRPRPAKGSQSKTKRDGDGEWPSTEWDELSDVDYWAELASDKPLTTGPQPATPPARSERERDRAEARADNDPVPSREPGASREPAQSRGDRRPEPADSGFAARTESYGSTELRRAIAAGSEPARTASSPGRTSVSGADRMPQPDDDPLTSPSFPRVAGDDSRSYRRSRSDTGPGRRPAAPARPPASYQPAPQHPPVGPLDSLPGVGRSSGSYSVPATGGVGYGAPPSGHSDPYRQPVSQAADGYLPPVGNGYRNESVTAAYPAPMPPASGYSPPALPAPPSYQAPDSPSYSVPMPSQAMPSQAMPSQPLPSHAIPSTAGYASPDGTGYYASGQHSESSGYAGYSYPPGAGPGAGAQPQTAQYSYSAPADSGFAPQLPAGQTVPGYGGYQPPGQTDMAGIYQVPGTQGMLPPAGGFGGDFSPPGMHQVQPGYPTAPYNSAPYEPPGYPANGYEADTALPADPYAVDPYGYPGYGSAR
jgi:hypothetical protein